MNRLFIALTILAAFFATVTPSAQASPFQDGLAHQAAVYQDAMAHYKNWAKERYAILAEQLSLGVTPVLSEADALQRNEPTHSEVENSTYLSEHGDRIYSDFVARERSLRSTCWRGCQQQANRLSQAYWDAEDALSAVTNAVENHKRLGGFPGNHAPARSAQN